MRHIRHLPPARHIGPLTPFPAPLPDRLSAWPGRIMQRSHDGKLAARMREARKTALKRRRKITAGAAS